MSAKKPSPRVVALAKQAVINAGGDGIKKSEVADMIGVSGEYVGAALRALRDVYGLIDVTHPLGASNARWVLVEFREELRARLDQEADERLKLAKLAYDRRYMRDKRRRKRNQAAELAKFVGRPFTHVCIPASEAKPLGKVGRSSIFDTEAA